MNIFCFLIFSLFNHEELLAYIYDHFKIYKGKYLHKMDKKLSNNQKAKIFKFFFF
jgi:hypothetical protein